MFKKYEALRDKLDPHGSLADLTIVTRSGVADPGLTTCRMRERMTQETVGILTIERQHGEYAQPTLRIIDMATPRRSAVARSVYFSAWFEMLLLAHDEERILMSKDCGNTHEEVAAWQWLAEGGVADVIEPFQPLMVGQGAIYYSGAALALPPSISA